MKLKKDETSVIDVTRTPSFIFFAGRGYTGKTFLNRYLYETACHPVIVGDGDRTNIGISKFVPQARVPLSSDERDVRDWLMALIDEQIETKTDLMLDLGGGDVILGNLARELNLDEFLVEQGIRPVLLHLMGPDPADLSILAGLERDKTFAPKCTAVIFNANSIPSHKSQRAFLDVIDNSPILQAAIARGVEVAVMPMLEPAGLIPADVTFSSAAAGCMPSGYPRLSPLRRQQIIMWLRAMQTDVRSHIEGWLP